MSILKVARLGHPVLRMKASDVEVADIKAGKFRALIDDMIETMHEYEGVGLAGPQIHLPLRVFVFEVQEKVAKRRGIAKLNAGVVLQRRLRADRHRDDHRLGRLPQRPLPRRRSAALQTRCAFADSITKGTRRSSK